MTAGSPEAQGGVRHNRWLTVITVDPGAFGAPGEATRLALEKENIESRPLWKPLHLQPVFQGCEVVTHPRPLPAREGRSVAEALFERGLCLPSGTKWCSLQRRLPSCNSWRFVVFVCGSAGVFARDAWSAAVGRVRCYNGDIHLHR